MTKVLRLTQVQKRYPSGTSEIQVLKDITLELEQGDICALVGPSGSGKTSLLGIAAGLEPPSAGEVEVCQYQLHTLNEEERAQMRNAHIGFVFQSFQLLPSLTAIENVMVPAELAARPRSEKEIREHASELLGRVGLHSRTHHYPTQLSGGEQQRVALARAFINSPKILLADEPTGNLDETTARSVEDLLFELHAQQNVTLLIATHNLQLAHRAQRLLHVSHGVLREERL